MTLYIEITEDGLLSIPKRSLEKMRLKAGMRFKLLADDDDVLVLRIVREEDAESQFLEIKLRRLFSKSGGSASVRARMYRDGVCALA